MAHRTRQHWLVVSTALLVVGLATTSAAFMSTRTASAGAAVPTGAAVTTGTASGSGSATPTAGRTQSGTAGRELQIGIDYSDTLPYETSAELATSLNDAVAVGAQWIRVDLAWEDYQPWVNIAPNFAKFDKVVAAADARGLKILATVGFPPPWARKTACVKTSACAPASPATFAQFARKAATRYAPMGLHDWEIWNEPNIAAWAPNPDPAAYTHLITATSTAIRAVDSHAYLLLGGQAASRPSPGAPYISAYDFITAVGKDGGLKSVDAVGYHPYPSDTAIATSSSFQAISSKPQNIVEALAEQGFPHMPVWITETGAEIREEANNKPNPATVQAEVQTQSTVATDVIPALDANPHVATMFWFSDKDAPASQLYFGLRTADGTHRPSFSALQKAIAAYRKQFPQPK